MQERSDNYEGSARCHADPTSKAVCHWTTEEETGDDCSDCVCRVYSADKLVAWMIKVRQP